MPVCYTVILLANGQAKGVANSVRHPGSGKPPLPKPEVGSVRYDLVPVGLDHFLESAALVIVVTFLDIGCEQVLLVQVVLSDLELDAQPEDVGDVHPILDLPVARFLVAVGLELAPVDVFQDGRQPVELLEARPGPVRALDGPEVAVGLGGRRRRVGQDRRAAAAVMGRRSWGSREEGSDSGQGRKDDGERQEEEGRREEGEQFHR